MKVLNVETAVEYIAKRATYNFKYGGLFSDKEIREVKIGDILIIDVEGNLITHTTKEQLEENYLVVED